MISMFQVDSAFALGLIALAAGMALIVWMRMHKEHTSQFCRGVAYLVVILAFLTLVCTTFYATKYWVRGYFSHPKMMMMKKRMPENCMMNQMKNNKSMMMNSQHMMDTQPMRHHKRPIGSMKRR